jgi:hypothetical protein
MKQLELRDTIPDTSEMIWTYDMAINSAWLSVRLAQMEFND